MNRRSLLTLLAATAAPRAAAALPAHGQPTMVPSSRLPKLGVCIRRGIDPSRVIPAMRLLGVTRYRSDAPLAARELGYFQALAEAGLTACIDVNGWQDQGMIDVQLGLIRDLVQRHPTSVDFIEGPNEVNNNPQTWNRQADAKTCDDRAHTAAGAVMDYIVEAVAGDAALRSIPVVCYTDCTPFAVRPGSIANLHVYDNATPNGPVDWWLAVDGLGKLQRANPGLSRFVVTETGTAQKDPELRALYVEQMLATLGQMAAQGCDAAYVYSLYDQDGDSYGLFDASWTPRPAAEAFARMRSFLHDPAGAGAASPLQLQVNAPDGAIQKLLVAMSDGSYRLCFWSWNPPLKPFDFTWSVTPTKVVTVQRLQTAAPRVRGLDAAGQLWGCEGYAGALIALELR